jgi:tetratricopeptide (TPR) repeat protein
VVRLRNTLKIQLLLLLAQVELANGASASALNYIGQALFIEPVLREGLQLQAQTYLALAAEAPSGSDQQVQYYGLAVVSAQTLLLYYEGDPAGYLYLAQARLGEGNLDLAEEALSRVLAVEDTLPVSDEAVLREARRIRGDLYYDQGRFQDAWNDLEPVAVTRGALDVAIGEKLVDIAFRLEDYVDALDWIDQLRFEDPDNAAYVLLEAKIRVEICAFRVDLPCQYNDMLDVLDDQFVNTLGSDSLRAEAYAYRAQALYGNVLERESISEDERIQTFRSALNDLDQALTLREYALDHYYRALILEALDEPVEALKNISGWNTG